MAESIVRSLLVSVGFTSDKKSLVQTEGAIKSLRLRMAGLATAAIYAGTRIISALNQFADATLTTEGFSRALGIGYNELVAFQKAARSFRLDDSQFNAVLGRTNQLLADFKRGAGDLFEIARVAKFDILPNDNALDILQKVLKYLSEIENEQQRIRIAGNLFPNFGVQISDIAKSLNQFNASAKDFVETQGDLSAVPQAAKAYEEAINALNNSLGKLTQNIVTVVAPALLYMIDVANKAIEFYRNFSPTSEGALQRLIDFELKQFEFVPRWFNSFKEWVEPYTFTPITAEESMISNMNSTSNSSPQMTNNIEINVPQGTTEEQASFISTQIINAIDDRIFNTFMNIQSNNPVVE